MPEPIVEHRQPRTSPQQSVEVRAVRRAANAAVDLGGEVRGVSAAGACLTR